MPTAAALPSLFVAVVWPFTINRSVTCRLAKAVTPRAMVPRVPRTSTLSAAAAALPMV